MRPRFFWVLIICISVRKTIENHICFGAVARKVENLVRFLSNFDPYFPIIRRVWKSCKIYIESIGIYCKYIESIESMEVKTLESNALPFHFAWRVLRDLIIHLILMSRGRKAKPPKLSKLVLGAEFLFTTFKFWFGFNRSGILCCIASKFWNWIVSP